MPLKHVGGAYTHALIIYATPYWPSYIDIYMDVHCIGFKTGATFNASLSRRNGIQQLWQGWFALATRLLLCMCVVSESERQTVHPSMHYCSFLFLFALPFLSFLHMRVAHKHSAEPSATIRSSNIVSFAHVYTVWASTRSWVDPQLEHLSPSAILR